ncbi:MAG: aldo/keto reductase [Pirellulales bacterium]
MPDDTRSTVSRRAFVQETGLLAGGLLLGASAELPGAEPAGPAKIAADPLPRRTLGKTNVPVTILTLGTAPCGISSQIKPPEIARIVNEAIDLGVTSIDTAPAYVDAEEGVGLALGRRRKEVFLATKVGADTLEDAEKSLSQSLRLLKTDYVDLVYYHSLGNRKIEGARDAGGVFNWLVKQKKAGKFRFLGVSGHNLPGRFPPFLESGEVDVMMTVINFVDRHTYGFEEKILPIARRHNIGIIAMKVFGGARAKSGSYENPKAPPEMDERYLESAVRYALGTPGVATVNLGVHNAEQLRKNVRMARAYRPLSPAEQESLVKLGPELAKQWGPHFGPAKES